MKMAATVTATASAAPTMSARRPGNTPRRRARSSSREGGVGSSATSGRGADFIIEATGNPDALGESLGLLSTEGVAIIASWYGTKQVTLPLGAEFHRRRLEIRSSQVSTIGRRAAGWDRDRRRAEAQALLAELPLSSLASHTFPFERAPEAYAALDRGDDGVVHVALAYS